MEFKNVMKGLEIKAALLEFAEWIEEEIGNVALANDDFGVGGLAGFEGDGFLADLDGGLGQFDFDVEDVLGIAWCGIFGRFGGGGDPADFAGDDAVFLEGIGVEFDFDWEADFEEAAVGGGNLGAEDQRCTFGGDRREHLAGLDDGSGVGLGQFEDGAFDRDFELALLDLEGEGLAAAAEGGNVALDLGDFGLGLLALTLDRDEGNFAFPADALGGAALFLPIDVGLGHFRLDLFEALIGDQHGPFGVFSLDAGEDALLEEAAKFGGTGGVLFEYLLGEGVGFGKIAHPLQGAIAFGGLLGDLGLVLEALGAVAEFELLLHQAQGDEAIELARELVGELLLFGLEQFDVEVEQGLSGLDGLAFFDVDAGDRPGDRGIELDGFALGFESPARGADFIDFGKEGPGQGDRAKHDDRIEQAATPALGQGVEQFLGTDRPVFTAAAGPIQVDRQIAGGGRGSFEVGHQFRHSRHSGERV